MPRTFDVIVIGSGSGMEVVSDAVDRGLRVAVIEHGPFGGTCLNRGCIPSKMLIHVADVMETIKRAELFGIKASVQGIDWDFIIRRTFQGIDEEAAGIEDANKRHPQVTVYKDTARFVGDRTLAVGGEVISAGSVVIAAGTRPSIPSIPGLDTVPYVTSDDALRLPQQPETMVIVGGGFVAAELAHFFSALGTWVTLVHRRHTLLREEDEEVSTAFTDLYRRKLELITDATVQSVHESGAGVGLVVDIMGKRRTVFADALLLATGRQPNADILDVAQTGVRVDSKGFIVTDEYLQTTAPGVWALGDIVGRYMLKHSANLEAAYVAHNLFNPEQKVAVDHRAMPHAVFAAPQVASVGLTEQQARARGLDFVVARYDYKDTAYGQSIEDKNGFVKVLADAGTRDILGCHILGTDASMLIQEAANAMRAGLKVNAITNAVYVHPALPEVVQRAFGALQFPGTSGE